MSDDAKVPLPDLESGGTQMVADAGPLAPDNEPVTRGAADLEAVFDVPVQVSAVLGRARMEIGELLRLGPGTVLELDRKVGEAIDIYVNNRLVARRGCPRRGQARRDDDGNHQGGSVMEHDANAFPVVSHDEGADCAGIASGQGRLTCAS